MKKYIIQIVIILLLIGGIYSYPYYKNSQYESTYMECIELLIGTQKKLESLESALEDHYETEIENNNIYYVLNPSYIELFESADYLIAGKNLSQIEKLVTKAYSLKSENPRFNFYFLDTLYEIQKYNYEGLQKNEDIKYTTKEKIEMTQDTQFNYILKKLYVETPDVKYELKYGN